VSLREKKEKYLPVGAKRRSRCRGPVGSVNRTGVLIRVLIKKLCVLSDLCCEKKEVDYLLWVKYNN